MSAIITCLSWVSKGCAKEVPDKVQLSKEEVAELLSQTKKDLKNLGEEEPEDSPLQNAKPKTSLSCNGKNDDEDIEELYDLHSYDDEFDCDRGEDGDGVGGLGLSGLTLYASNEDDPYITLKEAESSDEEDSYRIYPTDNLICIGKAEEDFGVVEVHVYSDSENHHFCHHDIILGAFPLSIEWLDYDPEYPDKKGSLLAVGKMDPIVEVWDLDIVDSLEPAFCLGEGVKGKKSKKKKKKSGKKKSKETEEEIGSGHSDAVLCISWNKAMRNVLATGSADCSVRVWDLSSRTTLLILEHDDKVQCLEWHPYQPQTLLTGCFDKLVRLYDCVAPKNPKCWKVSGEVEKVLWNHLDPTVFVASCEDGMVFGMSVTRDVPLFQLKAHDQAVSDISLSCNMPGLLSTVSSDGTMKVWDVQNNKPAFLLAKDLKMGSLYTGKFSTDGVYTFAVGGEKDGLRVVQLNRTNDVFGHFKDRAMIKPVLPNTRETKMAASQEEMKITETSTQGQEESNEVAMETQMESGLLDQAMSLEPVETSSIEALQPIKRMKKLVLLLVVVLCLSEVSSAPSFDSALEEKKKELKVLEEELNALLKSKESDDAKSKETVKGESLNGPADSASFDPAREPPNVVTSGRFLALQSLADTSRRFSCQKSTCSSSGCGHYLLSYAEWKDCYSEVFKVYRRDGQDVVRVGDYIGLLQYKSNEWIQCSSRSCQLGTCPGQPSISDGFADSSKWCDCSEYSFRISAYNKTLGQALYPGDVVMVFQPTGKEFLSITGHTSTCPGTTFPPLITQYEECIENNFILNY